MLQKIYIYITTAHHKATFPGSLEGPLYIGLTGCYDMFMLCLGERYNVSIYIFNYLYIIQPDSVMTHFCLTSKGLLVSEINEYNFSTPQKS